MLEWPLRVTLQWPVMDQFNIMYISGLAKGMDYRSDVLEEFKKRTLQQIRAVSGKNQPSGGLAPLVGKIFKDDGAENPPTSSASTNETEPYRTSLKNIEEAGSRPPT